MKILGVIADVCLMPRRRHTAGFGGSSVVFESKMRRKTIKLPGIPRCSFSLCDLDDFSLYMSLKNIDCWCFKCQWWALEKMTVEFCLDPLSFSRTGQNSPHATLGCSRAKREDGGRLAGGCWAVHGWRARPACLYWPTFSIPHVFVIFSSLTSGDPPSYCKL